jgi:glycosyltransferase involved in cell wall biosynthesis
MSEFATCCILSYNRHQFLRDMLTTMIAYADYPMQIIVHDDGSTDEGLRKYQRELSDNGVISTLIQNPPGHNEGQGIALNRMFAMAKGDPIVKLDHDLIFKPGWLRKSVDLINLSFRDIDLPRIGALGLFKYLADHPTVNSEKSYVTSWGAGALGFEEHRDFVGSAMVIPRAAYQMFGPFNERSAAFAEDNEFKVKVTDHRERWVCALPEMDLAENQGFGVGPSTIAIPGEDGGIGTTKIKEGPHLIRPQNVQR